MKKLPILITLLAGTLLRVYRLTSSSIWHDEGYTMWLVRYNFVEIIKRTARDVHPPAYYLILKPWITIFGASEFSARFLSVVFSVGIIWLTYKIVKEIWSKEAAFYSSLFVALSPFMIRFGQEARMYGVVAFFTTLASYFFVKYLKEGQKKWLVWYIPAMVAACYTQYYAFFAVISHWAIAALFTKKGRGLLDGRWWAANIAIFVAYLPWFPVAYKQITRVSGSYWIRPEWITGKTIPNSLFQFITYSHLDNMNNSVYWITAITLILSTVFFLRKYKTGISLSIFGYLPMILVFAISRFKTPIYQDRYFPFSAVAIFVIWGILITLIKNRYFKIVAGVLAVVVLLRGNVVMHRGVDHKMKEVANLVESQKQPGDIILSGELYSFLDGTYYFGDKNIKLISKGVDGFGETSLFYDQQKDYLVSPNQISNLGNRVWIIARSQTNSPYQGPASWPGWQITEFEKDSLKVVLYEKR